VSLLAQDTRLARKVGVVTLLVLGLAAAFVLFVWDRIEWGSHIRIAVYFHRTGGLHEGAPFVVAGRAIGDIESIALVPRGAPDTPLAGEEGVVAIVALAADEAARVVRGGDVFVASRGPFGESYLEIGPAPGPGPALAAGDKFLGHDPPTLDRVLQRTWDNLMITREFGEAVAPEFDALRTQLRALAHNLETLVPDVAGVASLSIEVRGLIDEARRLRDTTLGGDAGLAKAGATLDQARATIALARETLGALAPKARALGDAARALGDRLDRRVPVAIDAIDGAIAKARAAIDKIDPLLAAIADLNDRLARNEGSLGRLMHDPEFPEDAKELGKIMKRQPWKIIDRPDH